MPTLKRRGADIENALCATSSSFGSATVWPALITSSDGENWRPRWWIVAFGGGGVAARAPGPGSIQTATSSSFPAGSNFVETRPTMSPALALEADRAVQTRRVLSLSFMGAAAEQALCRDAWLRKCGWLCG